MTNDATFIEKAKLLALLANEKRLLIAYFISREEVSVGVLADRVGLSQSSLSQHLAKFREAKAVTTRRDARQSIIQQHTKAFEESSKLSMTFIRER